MQEIFVSTDIEANGPIPGPFSMLSLGSGAFTVDQNFKIELIDQFSVNIEELPGAGQDHNVMNFWSKHPQAWEETRKNPIPPKDAMEKYITWLKNLPDQVVFVAWPATYDFMFVYWYLMNFAKESPFKWGGLDMKSYSMGAKKQRSWTNTSQIGLKKKYSTINPLPHVAINDAIEQGWLFCNIYIENLK